MDPLPRVHVRREDAHRDMAALLFGGLDDPGHDLEVVGVPEGIEDQLDVLVRQRQRARSPRQVLLLPENPEHSLPGGGGDIRPAVEDLRDRGRGDTGPLSNLLQRHPPRPCAHATPHLCNPSVYGSRRIFATVSRQRGSSLAKVKFTDGYWQLRTGVQARYPAQVYDVSVEPDALTVYAPTRKIRESRRHAQRAAAHRCAAPHPAPDVISVSVGHFLGGRGRSPQFDLTPDPIGAGQHRRRRPRGQDHLGCPHGPVPAGAVEPGVRRRRSGAHRQRVQGDGAAHHRLRRAVSSASSSASVSARSCTASGSGSARWSRTARSSTSGTPTAAPAASRRTRTCRST